MFGNRLGWVLSGMIVAFTVAGLWVFYQVATAASLPGEVGRNARAWHMTLNPREAAGFMKEAGDASELYRQALASFEAKADSYELFRDRGTLQSPNLEEVREAMGPLVKARVMTQGGVLADRVDEVVAYGVRRGPVSAVKCLGDVAVRLARLYQLDGQKERARELYEAAYALGVRMYEERLVFEELEAAMEMLVSANYLAELEEGAAGDSFAQIDRKRVAFWQERVQPVQKAIFVTQPAPGDMIELAVRGGDVMWRVEGTLGLGRCRYSADRGGDQRAVMRVLRRLMNDSDSRVKLAAKRASGLTIELWRKLT